MASYSFGSWLKEQRQRCQLTQSVLGKRVGCAGETIRKIEASRVRPSLTMVERILQALDVPANEQAALIQWARTGTRLSSLPTPLTPLLGREREVAQVRHLLQQHHVRLLTLTGSPGVGKTRLAIAAADTLEHQISYNVTYIPMAAVRLPTMLLSSIAHRLGITETGHGDLFDQVVEQLQTYPRLLLLDNLEHLLDAMPTLSMLLAAVPHIKVLATSRAVLHLSGEHVYVVPPLPIPVTVTRDTLDEVAASPAVQLLLQRLQSRMPDLRLTMETAPLITTICQRLDGLPLAIELAAAHTSIVPLSHLVQQLETRLSFLIGGTRDVLQQHQTLRATLEWSYYLLPPPAQAMFRRLGVFISGGTLEAIAAVNGMKQHAVGDTPSDQFALVDVLVTLIDHSLLQLRSDDGEQVPRYQMLETVREFALEQLLNCGEHMAVQKAYIDYYLDLAEMAAPHMHEAQQQTWLQRLRLEQANLHAALQLALDQHDAPRVIRFGSALWRLWLLNGQITEGFCWLERILQQSDDIESIPYTQILSGAGWFAFLRGDYDQACTYYTRCLTMVQSLGDQKLVIGTLSNLGKVVSRQGRYAESQAYFEQAIAMIDQIDSNYVYIYNNLAALLGQQGLYDQSVDLLEEALVVARKMENCHAIGLVLNNLGYMYAQRGEYHRAVVVCEESLGYRYKSGYRYGVASSVSTRGRIALLQGDLVFGLAQLREGLYQFRTLGVQVECIECIEDVAEALGRQGQTLRAAQLWGAAAQLREHVRSPLLLNEINHFQTVLAQVQVGSDPLSWQTAWDTGRTLTLQQTIKLALDETDDVGHSSEQLSDSLVLQDSNANTSDLLRLTRREMDVVRLVAQGLTNQAIAEQLGVHQRTVKGHLQRMFHKVGVSSRAALVTWATQHVTGVAQHTH